MTRDVRRRQYLQAVGVGAVALSATNSASAAPTAVVVPDDEPTIQAGVDAVAAGGTVRVKPGSGPYTGQVNVGKPMTIVGDPGDDTPGAGPDAPLIDGNGEGQRSGFLLYQQGATPDDVTIEGFEIRNFGTRPEQGQWGHGVSPGSSNNGITVRDCTIGDVGAAGISVSTWGDRSYTDWTVERCRFENTPLAGVRFDHVSNATVRANEFHNPSPIPDEYPHFGVYLHANTREGNSGVQQGITVEDNRFVGDSDRASVYLLAINKNDASVDSVAALEDVSVLRNEFAGMPNTIAINTAVNSVRGGTTRMRNIEIGENRIREAATGVVLDSGAEEGLSGVSVSANDIDADHAALEVSGQAPAAIADVVSSENAYASGDYAVRVTAGEEGDAEPDRPGTDGVRFVGDEARGDRWPGLVVQTNATNGVGSVAIENVDASGGAGVFIGGHASGAVDSVDITGGTLTGTRGPGLSVRGLPRTDATGSAPLVDAVTVSNVDIRGTGGTKIAGDTANAIGSVAIDGLDIDVDEGPGFEIRGSGTDGTTTTPAVGPVSVADLSVAFGRGGGFRIAGESPHAVAPVDVSNLAVDATEVTEGGAGFVLRARAENAIAPITIDGATLRGRGPSIFVDTNDGENAHVRLTAADVTAESTESTGVTVTGRESGAIDAISLSESTIRGGGSAVTITGKASGAISSVSLTEVGTRSDAFYTSQLRALAPNAIDTVDIVGLTANDGGVGLFGFARDADGIGQLSIADSEFRRNSYGVASAGELLGDRIRIRRTNFVDNELPPESEFVGYGVANFTGGESENPNGTIDARHNYWGHPSGPTRPHPARENGKASEKRSDRPEEVGGEFEKRRGPPETLGKGDRVSDGVAFRPWLNKPA
ncbi:right-handed parallel beta-helix repeat-containing protein [Natronomonas sp. EA1]|uniref:right-handed parallel beta-helix repeat-containing protein n=1 Tax=Natronomonas sp. EA1 TaxID=3421655 RepID=UPI003EBD99BE